MTDTVKISLRLNKLSLFARMKVPMAFRNVESAAGAVLERYPIPTTEWTRAYGTSFDCLVFAAPDPCVAAQGDVPTEIEAELSVPTLLTNQKLAHGTSVYAAGRVGLEVMRIWLAELGLPRGELDTLTTADVSLLLATVTFLMPCATDEAAQTLLDKIHDAARARQPLGSLRNSSWDSVSIGGRNCTVVASINHGVYRFTDKAELAETFLMDLASRTVRLDVTLDCTYLASRDLLSLDSWRGAYELGLYESIFNNTVRNSLGLGGPGSRLNVGSLGGRLRYPGDYHPHPEHVRFCFCRASWPDWLEDLCRTYQEARPRGV